MAKVKKNVLLEGISGRIGDLVFKQYRDKTVVTARPRHDPKRKPTPGEARHRERIKTAASRAKGILATPEGDAYYQAARLRLGKLSAYHTAIFDFFESPVVENVKRGKEGGVVIQVNDNVGVKKVTILMPGGDQQADPLHEDPCHQWEWQPENSEKIMVQISAEDWMGAVGEWQGEI